MLLRDWTVSFVGLARSASDALTEVCRIVTSGIEDGFELAMLMRSR